MTEASYRVTSIGGQEITVKAKNSQDAKRKACKHWGRPLSDRWTGMSSLKAKKLVGRV